MRHRRMRSVRLRLGAAAVLTLLCSLTLFASSRRRWYTIYKDHVRLDDYEIHDGMGLELYYM